MSDQEVVGKLENNKDLVSPDEKPAASQELTPQNKIGFEGDKPIEAHEFQRKSLLRSDDLYQYLLNTSVLPNLHPCLKELQEITALDLIWNAMATTPDGGQFLQVLLKLINAKNTLEVGVYTGYSLLCTALALPDDGKIIAMDITREDYDKGAKIIAKAGVAHKVDFREGPALDTLNQILAEEANRGFFDFAFVDADKDNYLNYHEVLLQLIKMGGLIVYDNTLWGGSVVFSDDEPAPEYIHKFKGYILELNRFLAADSRVEICQLTVADGMTLCRKIK